MIRRSQVLIVAARLRAFIFFLLLTTVLFPQSQQPYFEARTHRSEYHGPGRGEPAPENLTEIRFGYFGPTDLSHSAGGPLWIAAQMAIEEANRDGGYENIPFRLLPIWSENPWGSGISQLARSIYTDHLWAIVGSIDGPSTHLVEQLVAKARLTLINPVSSDKTINLANVPWMFSCLPGGHIQAPVLARGIAESAGDASLTMVSATDHDSRVFVKELRNHLAAVGVALTHHFEVDSLQNEASLMADQVKATRTKVVIIIADASVSAHLVKHLRLRHFGGQIFGGPNIGRTEFLLEAGSAATGVTFPVLVSLCDAETFIQNYETRSGTTPDYRAFQTYDAVTLLVAAVRKAGLNRARIRDAVRELSPWQGVSGQVAWDALGQNERPVRLATIAKNNQIETLQLKSR